MKKVFAVLVMVGWMLRAALAIEIPLTYIRYGGEHQGGDFQPAGYGGVAMKFKPPDGEWKLPELIGSKPVYGLAMLGNQFRLFVLSRQKEGDLFYNRMYFDANGNKDLTDDPFVDGEINHRREHDHCFVSFPAVDMTIPQDGRDTPYSFVATMSVSRFSQFEKGRGAELEQRLWVMLRSNGHYEGAFELNGRKYRVALSDASADGRFDKAMTYRKSPQGDGEAEGPFGAERTDMFYLSRGDRLSIHEWHQLGNHLVMDGIVFHVKVDIPGRVITLTEKTDGLAALKLGEDTEQLTLLDREQGNCVMAHRAGERVMLPQGSYRLLAYRVLKEDQWGDRWIMRGEGDGRSQFVEVKEGRENLLPLGQPLRVVVTAYQYRGGASYRLNFELKGDGGENIGDVAHISGTRTEIPLSSSRRNYPKEATYQVVRMDGEVVARGTFEYG